MDDFEKAIVEFIQRNKEILVVDREKMVVVNPRTIEIVQYGPVYSLDAQRKIFEAIYEAKMGQFESKSNINSGYENMFELEDLIQNRLIPTAIKDALRDILEVSEDEAERLFKLGPKEF